MPSLTRLRPRWRRTAAVMTAVALAATATVLGSSTSTPVSAGLAPGAQIAVFEAGTDQSWSVPAGVTQIFVDLQGGAGGDVVVPQAGNLGGHGGRVLGPITVTPGSTFIVDAAGDGTDNGSGPGGGGVGGDRGGHGGWGPHSPGAGGGGATTLWPGGGGPALAVAPGGGGAGGHGSGWFGDAGDGGFPAGDAGDCDTIGEPGAPREDGEGDGEGGTAGYAGTGGDSMHTIGGDSGSGGQGGDGADGDEPGSDAFLVGGGGGGGGLFGGGGGGSAYDRYGAGCGGGGSGLAPAGTFAQSGVQLGGTNGARILSCSASCTPYFPDVSRTHPFFFEIELARIDGITSGYDDGTYRGGARVSRQAIAAFLYRLSGDDYQASETPTASDVAPGHPFYEEIHWAMNRGVAGGYPDGTFRPGAPMTRQAMASFLFKAAFREPGQVTFPEPSFELPATPSFSDVPASHPFAEAIEWMASVPITGGYADGTFKGGGPVTRQAIAAFLVRYEPLAGVNRA